MRSVMIHQISAFVILLA